MLYSKYAIFLKVIEFGSMSKAAMYCNYSQSAVSQIISSMEKELQLTLLNRSSSGIRLTPAGEHMLPYIKSLQQAEDTVFDQSAKLRGIEFGHIRIGTFSSVSCHILIPILKEFKSEYPNISIEVREGDNLTIESWLTGGSVDFGFIDAPTMQGFESISICRDPFVAVMAADSKYAASGTVPLEIFEEAPMALFDEGTKKEAVGILYKNKIKPKIEYTSRDDNVILSLIEHNLCLGFMGKLILTRTQYKVVSRKTTPQFYRDIIFTVKDRTVASAAAQRFIEFIERYINSANFFPTETQSAY